MKKTAFVLAFAITFFGCLFFILRIYPSNKTKLNEIGRGIYGYVVTGDNPYIEYGLERQTDIKDIKIKISGLIVQRSA